MQEQRKGAQLKKRALKNKALGITFNEKDLNDYVTGFHKRKKKRRKEAQKQQNEALRRKRNDERKRVLSFTLPIHILLGFLEISIFFLFVFSTLSSILLCLVLLSVLLGSLCRGSWKENMFLMEACHHLMKLMGTKKKPRSKLNLLLVHFLYSLALSIGIFF